MEGFEMLVDKEAPEADAEFERWLVAQKTTREELGDNVVLDVIRGQEGIVFHRYWIRAGRK